MNFIKVTEENMKKSDKKALSTLYLYWLENNKLKSFDLPLFIDDNGKGVLSAEAFGRVFFAFVQKSKIAFKAEAIGKSDGENSFKVVHISETCGELNDFEEPQAKDIKRESSAKTKEKSEQKKEAAKKEVADLNKSRREKSIKEIEKIACDYGQFKADNLRKFIVEIEKILKNNF